MKQKQLQNNKEIIVKITAGKGIRRQAIITAMRKANMAKNRGQQTH